MSATIYTKVSDEVNALIERLAKEKGITKADIIRDLLDKGLDTEQILLEAEKMKEKLLEVETVKQTILELEQKYGDEFRKIDEAIDQMFKTLTEEIRKVSERPQLITPEDAKILRQHIDTCTFPDCPYKAVFPELAPEQAETSEEQARPEPTEHKAPRRWSLSDIGRKAD